MKITACYIVRNEGRNLKRSLESIRSSVDEIVLVDTGSTDDTKAIAASYGARIYDFPWQGDFSKARNFALEQLDTDWVTALDGDEYFSADTAGNLRRVIERADGEGKNLLLVPWHNVDEDTGEVLLDSHAPRIFRMDPGFRYEGRIHEELRDRGKAIQGIGILSPKELELVHTGYSAKISKEKARRNAQLLLKELEERKEPGNLYMYLAEAYDGLEDEEAALRYARLDIGMGRRNIVYASRSWRILLRRLAARPADREEHDRIAAEAVRLFPELPEFHGEYAESLAFQLDFPGAIREAKAGERAFETYGEEPRLEPMFFDGEMLETLKQRKTLWEKILLRARDMKITSCLIVRDGEQDMESWLDNTAHFSNQRVVVDTGSVDRTLELARAGGCEVQEIQWNRDFSQARNAAIAKAEGDWISFIDVDEAFEHPEQVRPFLAWLECCFPDTEGLMAPWNNIDQDDGGREICRSMVLRLFRNHRNLSYRGNVHETLYRSNGELPKIFQERQRLCLRHWGYSTGRILAKTERNMALLREDIALHGEGPQHYRYLADCYATLEEWEEVLTYGQKAMSAELQPLAMDSKMQHLVLTAMERMDMPFSEQEATARRFCEEFPLLPDFHGALGILLAERGEKEEAATHLSRALTLAEEAMASGRPTDFANEEGEVCAWAARLCGGSEEESVALLQRAMDASPRNDAVLNIVRDMGKDLSPTEFRRWLEPWIPQSKEGDIWLVRWARRNGHEDLLREWQGGDPLFAEGEIVAGMTRNVRRIVRILLCMEIEKPLHWRAMKKQCQALLPEAMNVVWDAYEGRGSHVPSDGFRALWPMVRAMGDDGQLAGFGRLSMELGESEWRSVIRDLMADEKWDAACALFGEVPADSPLADGAFWRDAGICFWHRGEREIARECFQRSREMGMVSKAMDAYESWGEEVLG